MRAHLANQAERGSHGFLMSEAMDPANQFAFVASEKPRVDYAEKARLDAQTAYYKKWDRDGEPVNRHGHLFTVQKVEGREVPRPHVG